MIGAFTFDGVPVFTSGGHEPTSSFTGDPCMHTSCCIFVAEFVSMTQRGPGPQAGSKPADRGIPTVG
eukprot:2839087-Lingulodinium_polyedra.AAC.1